MTLIKNIYFGTIHTETKKEFVESSLRLNGHGKQRNTDTRLLDMGTATHESPPLQIYSEKSGAKTEEFVETSIQNLLPINMDIIRIMQYFNKVLF